MDFRCSVFRDHDRNSASACWQVGLKPAFGYVRCGAATPVVEARTMRRIGGLWCCKEPVKVPEEVTGDPDMLNTLTGKARDYGGYVC